MLRRWKIIGSVTNQQRREPIERISANPTAPLGPALKKERLVKAKQMSTMIEIHSIALAADSAAKVIVGF